MGPSRTSATWSSLVLDHVATDVAWPWLRVCARVHVCGSLLQVWSLVLVSTLSLACLVPGDLPSGRRPPRLVTLEFS